MKKIIYLLSILLVVSLLGCGTPTASTPAITAEGICNSLKASGLPMDNTVVYTEETDTNKLLGRPNQYTSKTSFKDTRSEDSRAGGTIEVFSNQKDAKSRKDYIESVTKDTPLSLQYMYLKENVLLRIDHDLTPSQAAEYEVALGKLIK